MNYIHKSGLFVTYNTFIPENHKEKINADDIFSSPVKILNNQTLKCLWSGMTNLISRSISGQTLVPYSCKWHFSSSRTQNLQY